MFTQTNPVIINQPGFINAILISWMEQTKMSWRFSLFFWSHQGSEYFSVPTWVPTRAAVGVPLGSRQPEVSEGNLRNSILVGGWATPLKNMSQLGWWHKPNISGKHQKMATIHHQPVMFYPFEPERWQIGNGVSKKLPTDFMRWQGDGIFGIFGGAFNTPKNNSKLMWSFANGRSKSQDSPGDVPFRPKGWEVRQRPRGGHRGLPHGEYHRRNDPHGEPSVIGPQLVSP